MIFVRSHLLTTEQARRRLRRRTAQPQTRVCARAMQMSICPKKNTCVSSTLRALDGGPPRLRTNDVPKLVGTIEVILFFTHSKRRTMSPALESYTPIGAVATHFTELARA